MITFFAFYPKQLKMFVLAGLLACTQLLVFPSANADSDNREISNA
jgi:hypothetical protein